jgi:hypothetical protein
MLGKPLKAEDVALVCRALSVTGRTSTWSLTKATGLGIGKLNRIMAVLEAAHVVAKPSDGTRKILLRNEAAAVNAALRKLREGSRA